MPSYKVNDQVFTIPDDKIDLFEADFPEAQLQYKVNDGTSFTIPANKRVDFLADFPDAQEVGWEPLQAPEPQTVASNETIVEQQTVPQEEKLRGFRAGARESWKGLKAGTQFAYGEVANALFGSSDNDANALYKLDEMLREGKDVNAEVEGAWTDAGREIRTGAIEFLPGWMIKGWKDRVHEKAEQQKILDDIRDAIGEAGGDIAKARELLAARASDKSYGDIQKEKAKEKFADVQETEGLGAWVGENAVQMIPSASALIVGALTKSPGAARAIGMIGMGGMTAATAGSSMYEAREAGASDLETRKVGVVDGALEYITEKLPFDNYTNWMMGKAKSKVTTNLAKALRSGNAPLRSELEELLKAANKELGGKLFSKKNLSEYIADMIAEGASEFTAEASQTMTKLIYDNPDIFPLLGEAVSNGMHGALAGFFMGGVLGGAATTMEHQQHKQRRKEQGHVDVGVVDFGDGQNEIVEILSVDDDTNRATVLHNGAIEYVDKNAIGQSYRYSYEAFEAGRMKVQESEAIDNGNVTEGQIKASTDRMNAATTALTDALRAAGTSEEDILTIIESEQSQIFESDEVQKAYEEYIDARNRSRELTAAYNKRMDTQRGAKRLDIEEAVGEQFWRDIPSENADGVTTWESLVTYATLQDGRKVYLFPSIDATETAGITEDGQKVFVTPDMLVEGSEVTESLDAYLDNLISDEKKAAEQERMSQQTLEKTNEAKAAAQPGSQVNIGTAEEPVVGTVVQTTPDGVIVQSEAGVSQLSWEEYANAMSIGTAALTDEENASLEASEILSAESSYKAQQTTDPAEAENAVIEGAEAQTQAQAANIIPVKADGSVDQTTLWNQDPERWAQWNDEQRQDGGVNSLAYINGAIAKESARIAEMQAGYDAISDFDERDAVEREVVAVRERLQRLVNLRDGYVAQAEAAQVTAEEVAAETSSVPEETVDNQSNLTARMASEMTQQELNDLDEMYDTILSQTRVVSERARLLQEYLDKIAEGSTPIKVLTKSNYEGVMRAAGCPEADINAVGRVMRSLGPGRAIAGFVSAKSIFVMADGIPSIGEARVTYVHERQHVINTAKADKVQQMAMALGSKANALAVLEKFVGADGLAEYKNDPFLKLADEIIARCMEIAYTTEDFSLDLQSKGLSDNVISIIEVIDNEQRNDKSLIAARRSAHAGLSRRTNAAQDGRDSGQISGGILVGEENRSTGVSGEGVSPRSTGEGAEVISEEQLNAPNSGEPQQITAEDGEVIADTNGKGGVRFSIRTWLEGGRNYLAAWLDKDETLTAEEKTDILARMDEFYENAQKYTDSYVPFGKWSEAAVRYDSSGNPLMSVIKANGDYAMNLDFSLVCKKRRPLNRLLRTLINRNAFGTYSLKEREIAEINWILQEHGFEVACALCFVDSKRYRVSGVADVFAALYNKMVKALAPEGTPIAHFNYNNNPNVEVVENGIDTLADDHLNWDNFEKYASRFKPTSVEGKVAQFLRDNPSQRRLVDATDFIEAEGFEAVKANNQDLLKLYNAKKGTGGPKASFGDVQYLNDILKKEKSFDVDKAYSVGGVRIQSFSDFVPHMYFDYMQLFAELAAKKLPAHAYTKEVLFAKIFGLTGLKINLSLVPAVVDGGVAPGLDAEGNYAWADAVRDPEGNVIQQAQSFPFEEAMAIQNAPGYSRNCGAIAVGISDEHIEKMLDDPNIQFIIPYHKSSLNAIVARMTNIDQYKDYTNVQTTKKASGTKLDKDTKDFNFNEHLHNLGENGTPQQAAQEYLDWCRENNFRPKFSQFAYHPNYYKLLVDFNTIDTTTGEYTPQGAVTMSFPTEQNAFGNVEALIEQGLGEDMQLEEKMEVEIDEIADEVEARLEEISKEPKLTEKQQLKKMAELADERAAQIKAKAGGVIDLVEEARKADLRHRITAEETLVPGHKKGQPMLSDAEMMADVVSFRITKNTKATIEKWCDKADMPRISKEAFIAYLDDAFEDTTEQLCAAKWYLNGKINLPHEDEYKVRDAVKVAKQNKVDALSYASPMDILNTFGQPKSKVKPIDPDTVKEFSNKKELPEGIVVYDVQDDFEGQAAVRKIIDTHRGEDANPWCLAARTNGDLERAKDMWLHYSKYPKRIAFRNGRLLAFYASANDKTWWDRNDEPHTNIPYSVKSKEGEYEVSTNYELKEGNKKAKKVSVGKSDKKGRTAYFVGNRLESAGIQDGERNLFYSSFPAGATLSDSTYGVGRSLEVQYGPYKNVTQISFERRTKDEPTYYVRVGYGNNGVRAISFVEGARSWDIRYGINGDQIFVGRAQLLFNLDGELDSMYSGAYSMQKINDEYYEFFRGEKAVGVVKKYEKVTMKMLEEFGEDGAPVGALLDFINDMGWDRADYPYPNPMDADLLRRDDEVREQIRKVENEINEIAGGRYLSSVPAIRFRVTPEQDKAYMDAVEAGDMETAQRMVIEAARLAMPNTKVVDEDDNPRVVYHGTNATFTKFDPLYNSYSFKDYGAIFFTSDSKNAKRYGGNVMSVFLNMEDPDVYNANGLTYNEIADNLPNFDKWSEAIIENIKDSPGGTDKRIRKAVTYVIGKELSFQIKSAEPVTYDNDGNVIPLSERFNSESEDIRFRVSDEAVELYEETLNEYRSKYNEVAPTSVVDIRSRKSLADALGVSVKELGWLRYFTTRLAVLRGLRGGYAADFDRIAIFADNSNMDRGLIESKIFHESIHKVTKDNPQLLELGKWMWDNLDTITANYAREAIKKDYDKAEYADEMVSCVVGTYMSIGKTQHFLSYLPEEHKANVELIFNTIGYESEREDRERDLRRQQRDDRGLVQEQSAGRQMEKESVENQQDTGTSFRIGITPEVRDEMDAIKASAIVMGNFMKAPNGKDTNLTEEQWLMVRTKGFKNWFGDWENDPENASKVVDENGEPRIMHHGSDWQPLSESAGYAVFNMNDGLLGKGAYFASSLMEATMYAEMATGLDTSIDGNLETLQDEYVSDYFLNIRDKKDIFEFGDNDIIAVTKSPSQIKSATDNTGEFSEADGDIRFRTTGTPTEDIVAEGVSLSPAQLASLAGDIFAAHPEDSRKKITDGLNGNILGLQDAILQIPTSLATKENWNDDDRQMAEVVAEQMTKAVGKEMTRPFSASEALWTLYNAVNKSTDLVSEASRALVRRNLGFDSQTLEMEDGARDGVRFRTVGDASANAKAALYNKGAVNMWTRLKESLVDMYASVEEMVKAIEKKSGKVAQGFENVLMALNQQASKGDAAVKEYELRFLEPMLKEINKIMEAGGFKYEDVVRYVILKHGLERNDKFAKRDAREYYRAEYDKKVAAINANSSLSDAEKQAKIADAENEYNTHLSDIDTGFDLKYQEFRNNDYSGLSSMFYDTLGVSRKDYATEEEYQAALMSAKRDKYSSLMDIETAAENEVADFERAVNTDALWNRINAATKETLRQQYKANMISKDQYDNLRDMFEFYVPLRGFADNTAEDMYTYYRKPNSTGYTKPILAAEGRKTQAESPFGWIAAMAGSAIASNVKNEAKLALYYFVSNRPDNGIATITRTWFMDSGEVDADGKKIFKPAYPPFTEDLSTDAGKAAYEAWQQNMRDLRDKGMAYESGQRLSLGNAVVNISDAHKPEHIVNVKVGGKDYSIIINGNPRAAQAINGDLNIEATDSDYSALFGPMLRWMSSVNTSYNPEFWMTNFQRDIIFTFMAINAKEDPAYRRKFSKNYLKAFKVIKMVYQDKKGTLGDEYLEKMYKEFQEHGSKTGYTKIKSNEEWEEEINKYMKSHDPNRKKIGKILQGTKDVFEYAHMFGESLEQVSRFAAFLTSREMGKTIEESVNDAKEITVNFNRKGSGKRITFEEAKYLTDKNGQPLNIVEQAFAVGLSSISPLGRRFIMFFNASIQGLNSMYKLYKKSPRKMVGWTLAFAAIGAINALLHSMFDDDDDYLDMPEYERRNALMLGGNGVYLKWALPQEARAYYALGDLAVETLLGRSPHESFLGEAAKIGSELLPINPTEGKRAFLPSAAIPVVELWINEDYKGDPIYNDQKWLTDEEKKRTAKWSKAYQGTGKTYVSLSKVLNSMSGGDEYNAGWINIQPEKVQHLVQSAFGGTIRTADKFINSVIAGFDSEEQVTVRQFPFLNRFLTINDERYRNVHVNDVYDYYSAEAEHTIRLEKQYTKDRNADALKDLKSSDEYKWARIYSKYKKPIKKYQEKIKAAEGTAERMELMKQQDGLKRKMIKEISDL